MTAPAMTTPLVRSLVPLPDETLPGYLLRLSHRLELTPARLARRAGLHHNWTATAQSLLTLDEERTAGFAEFTRLEPAQVRDLLLCRYGAHYPPVRLVDSATPSPLKRLPRRGAVLTDSSRYCPDCLAGDGSEIQQRHGGAWRQAWRLQVVFACPLHQRLLEHSCPSCAVPAFRGKTASSVIALIPEMTQPVSHPAQCRTNRCGTRLDTLGAPAPGPAQAVLELQARILERLDPHGPVPPDDATQYFALLLLTVNMVVLSWPAVREAVESEPLRNAADTHVSAARRKFEDALTRVGANATINAPMRQLPLESAATAGLLLIADSILGWPQLYRLPERLQPLIELASAHPEAWYPLRTSQHWPPAVRRAFLPKAMGFAIPTRASRIAPVPVRECRFGPEHVPQRLPESWCETHLGQFADVSPTHTRRAAALNLVEQCSGLAWPQAAELLRIPFNLASVAVNRTRSWMRDPQHQHAFENALEQLAHQLDISEPLINYAARRTALQDWEIPDEDWTTVIHDLEVETRLGRSSQIDHSSRRRPMISALIWTFATSGEYSIAPVVLADIAANPAPQSRVAAAVAEFLSAPDTPYYRTLRRILTNYTNKLTEHIDQAAAAHSFTWTPSAPRSPLPTPRRIRRQATANGATP
jgi:hypothetical protein